MHEYAIAEGIVSSLLELIKNKKGKIIKVKILIGKLVQFDKELMKEILFEIVKETELKSSKIIIEEEKALIKCLNCRSQWDFDQIVKNLNEEEKEVIHFFPETIVSFSKCSSCFSNDLEIVKGRSVKISEIVIEK